LYGNTIRTGGAGDDGSAGWKRKRRGQEGQRERDSEAMQCQTVATHKACDTKKVKMLSRVTQPTLYIVGIKIQCIIKSNRTNTDIKPVDRCQIMELSLYSPQEYP